MEQSNYLEQLKDIRKMMDQSIRFISLSGLSGVLAGVYAIAGAWLARMVLERGVVVVSFHDQRFLQLLAIAGGILGLSVITAFVLSRLKAKKNHEKIWNAVSKRLLLNFAFPLLCGGAMCVFEIRMGHFLMLAPTSLIFYGLALINSSKYTLETVRSLGVVFCLLGIAALIFPNRGLPLWILGFGVLHIVYGTYMYLKFDRKQA